MPDTINPQALNRYSYVVNNPIKYIDPCGHGFGLFEIISSIVIAAVACLVDDAGGNVSVGASISTDTQGNSSISGYNPNTGESYSRSIGPPNSSYSNYIGGMYGSGARSGFEAGGDGGMINLTLHNRYSEYNRYSDYNYDSGSGNSQDSINREMYPTNNKRRGIDKIDIGLAALSSLSALITLGAPPTPIGLYVKGIAGVIGLASTGIGLIRTGIQWHQGELSDSGAAIKAALTVTPF